jgi:hypothetical protein
MTNLIIDVDGIEEISFERHGSTLDVDIYNTYTGFSAGVNISREQAKNLYEFLGEWLDD